MKNVCVGTATDNLGNVPANCPTDRPSDLSIRMCIDTLTCMHARGFSQQAVAVLCARTCSLVHACAWDYKRKRDRAMHRTHQRYLAKTQLPTTWNIEPTGQSVLNLGCRQPALTVPHQLRNAPLRARHLHRHLLPTQHGASVTAGHKAELRALHISHSKARSAAETDGAILRESDKLKPTQRMGRPPSLRGESAGRPGVVRGRPAHFATLGALIQQALGLLQNVILIV